MRSGERGMIDVLDMAKLRYSGLRLFPQPRSSNTNLVTSTNKCDTCILDDQQRTLSFADGFTIKFRQQLLSSPTSLLR
jgi:hypothetical protein